MKTAPIIIVQLIHIEGPMKGDIQEFSDPEIAIGRHPSCQVRFPKDMTSISRNHAKIIRQGNRFRLVNQGANGTFVNGKRAEEAFLKNGDVLTIAEAGPKVSFLTEMRVQDIPAPQVPEISAEPPATPPPSSPATSPPITPAPPSARQEQPTPQPQPATPAPLVQTPVPPPMQEAPPVPPTQAAAPPPPPPAYEPPPQAPAAIPGAPEGQPDIPVQRVKAPLIIQHGPTIRSFNELPITIGKGAGSDFVINSPAILDQHARIFVHLGQYWIKDLTGTQSVSVNNQPINFQSQLSPDDQLSLSVSGPRFRFLGGGRLAEIEDPIPQQSTDQETPRNAPQVAREGAFSPRDQADKIIKGAKNVLDKFLQR